MTATEASISVIISVYESWPLLRLTLASVLFDCRSAGGQWEIILVDNESDPNFVGQIENFTAEESSVRVIRRTGLKGHHFQPGAARNTGIEAARFNCLIFLDADCIPSPALISQYRTLAGASRDTVFLSHRVFIDSTGADAQEIAQHRQLLNSAPRVVSTSDYGRRIDRRMDELLGLSQHPRPYDCLFGCTFALHRDCLGRLRFDPVFDGHWGYEDIELGYRLHKNGRCFQYVPDAFVYHQEEQVLSAHVPIRDRKRNFAIAASLIPGFHAYRRSSPRAGAVPDQADSAD